VICSHALEHTENPEAFLGEVGRVAARGIGSSDERRLFPRIRMDCPDSCPESDKPD
jgi:hypothetical protein